MRVDSTPIRRPFVDVVPAPGFTDAMASLASGVVMVTSWVEGRPWGMTISAFTSISADPPTVLVSLRSDTASAQAIEQAGSYGISILGQPHVAAARHGAAPGAAKFLERFADPDVEAPNPAVAGALAHLDCEVTDRLEIADHTIFIGRVRAVRMGAGGEPLLYFRRSYRALAPRANRTTRRRTPCLSS